MLLRDRGFLKNPEGLDAASSSRASKNVSELLPFLAF